MLLLIVLTVIIVLWVLSILLIMPVLQESFLIQLQILKVLIAQIVLQGMDEQLELIHLQIHL